MTNPQLILLSGSSFPNRTLFGKRSRMEQVLSCEGRYLSGIRTTSRFGPTFNLPLRGSRYGISTRTISTVDHRVMNLWVQILVVANMDQQGDTVSDPAKEIIGFRGFRVFVG